MEKGIVQNRGSRTIETFRYHDPIGSYRNFRARRAGLHSSRCYKLAQHVYAHATNSFMYQETWQRLVA